MEKFKKNLKLRIVFYSILSVILIFSIITFNILNIQPHSSEVSYSDFYRGVLSGFLSAIFGVSVFYIIKYSAALKNKDKLKKIYIKEHDELTQQILLDISKIESIFITFGISSAMIIGGFFSKTIFWCFYCVFMYYCFIRKILYHIFKSKY